MPSSTRARLSCNVLMRWIHSIAFLAGLAGLAGFAELAEIAGLAEIAELVALAGLAARCGARDCLVSWFAGWHRAGGKAYECTN